MGQIAYREVNWCGTMSLIFHGYDWHDVIITRSRDGYWRMWIDGVFLHATLENDDFSNDEFSKTYDYLGIGISRTGKDPTCRMMMDDVEVYEDRYLMPQKSISMGEYAFRTLWPGSERNSAGRL